VSGVGDLIIEDLRMEGRSTGYPRSEQIKADQIRSEQTREDGVVEIDEVNC
jgi:hypothetical protein